jgi:hypothetical protein
MPRPVNIYTNRQLTRRESRKFDLTWKTDRFYWQNRMGKTGSPLAGIIDVARALGLDRPDWDHGQKLMLRIAYGGRSDRQAGKVAMPGLDL